MSRPTAAAIAAEPPESISTGRYGLGVQLPSASDLQARHGVVRSTVTTAIAILKCEGLVPSRDGMVVYMDGATTPQDSAVLTVDHALVYELPVEDA